MLTMLLAASLGAGVPLLAFSCDNPQNAGFPITIDLEAATGQTRSIAIGPLHVVGSTAEFFLLDGEWIIQVRLNRYSLQGQTRSFQPGAAVMADLRGRPQNSAVTRTALADDIANGPAAATTAQWDPALVCKKVQAAF